MAMQTANRPFAPSPSALRAWRRLGRAPFARSRHSSYLLPTPTLNDSEFTFETLYSTESRAIESWTEAPIIA